MKHLPTITDGVFWSLTKSVTFDDTLRLMEELTESNPLLAEFISYVVISVGGSQGEAAGGMVLTAAAMICKILDSQLEADAMDREFV